MPVRIKHRGLAPVLRKAAIFLLSLLVVLIAGSLIYSLRSRKLQPGEVSEIHSPELTYHEKFQALDFAGEKMKLSLKADHFSIDKDSRQYLEGKVEISDLESAGRIRVRAERVVLDPEKKLARGGGEVSLVAGSLRVRARDFEYDLKDKAVRTGSARLERDGLSLSAGAMVYSGAEGRVELSDDVAGEIKLSRETLFLSCRHLIIQPDGLNFLVNDFRLTAGKMSLASGSARLRLQDNGSALDSVNLENRAQARLEFRAGESEFDQISLSSEAMSLQAGGEIPVLRAAGVFGLEASGNMWQMKGRGEELELLLEEGRAPRSLKAGHFVSELKDSAGEEFRLAGRKADYDLNSCLLRMSGQAEVSHQHFSLNSERLEFSLKERLWSAPVFNLEILPGFFELAPLLFDGGKSIYVSGGLLAGRTGLFDLNGRVRIWQDEEFCQAERASLEGQSGRVFLEKLKKASWMMERADGRREKLELAADRASLQPEENRAVLGGAVELSFGHLRLVADELILDFSSGGQGRVSECEARGRVAFSWKGYRASGRQADLEFSHERLTLTGAPRLLTEGGERLEADKLTLYMADDRIRLDNQKRERSLTILVRGK